MSDLLNSLREHSGNKAEPPLTMEQYIEKVRNRPGIAAGAHRRVYDMIRSYGVKVDPESGEETYLFFERELFGIEDSLREVMEYFKGAALGSDVSKRFLLVYGPPSSGKSNLVSMIKEAMEVWTRTDQGAVYALEGCPMNEEPLHAIPKELRPRFSKELGVTIEGELCPVCAMRLRTELNGDCMGFKIKRVLFSHQLRTGLGTFVPSDFKSQDIAELIGSVDLSKIGEYGTESDPHAWKFDGELNVSNRGIMEFIEILKCVTPDSYVTTEKGLLRIDEIDEIDETRGGVPVDINLGVRGQNGVERADLLIPRGTGRTRKIRTSRGYCIEGAEDHRVQVVLDGRMSWLELRNVKPGTPVCINRVGVWPVEAPSLSKYSDVGANKKTTNFKVVPPRLTIAMAKLIGYYVAEGWFLSGDSGIGIAATKDEIIEDLRLIAGEIGVELHDAGRQRRFYSTTLARFFRNLGFRGRRARNKLVPRVIRAAPKEFVSAFLRSYFSGDGTVGAYGVSCTTASDRLAREIQLLLLNYGIISSRRRVFNRQYGRWYHSVGISDASSVGLFARDRKFSGKDSAAHRDGLPGMERHWKSMLDEVAKMAQGRKGKGEEYRRRDGARQIIGDYNYEQAWRFANGTTPSIRAARTVIDVLGKVIKVPEELAGAIGSGFFFDKAVSNTTGEGSLWDFRVPVGHSYVANGFVNHNCDQKFLYVLLTATQEKVIKTPRFPMISCDEVILSHTNESEYKEFVGNPKNEALIDRMIVCRIPYNLRVKDEVRIYNKLLNNGGLSGVHVAPHTLRVASMFAVLSRLEEPKDQNLDRVKKMKLYDGEEVEGFSLKDVPRILKESGGTEGMDGVSPRYIINRLVTTAIRGVEEDEESKKEKAVDFVEPKRRVKFITPIHVLRSLKDGLRTSSKFKPEERTRYEDLIAMVRKEFDEIAKNEVQKAFFVSFEDEAKVLLDNYIDNVEAYMEKVKLEDPITKEEVEPSEQLMRAIESKIGIGEGAKDSFRNEILRKVAAATRRGEAFRYDSHGRLREAIEKQLFEDRKDLIKMTITSRTKRDPDELKRINQVVQTLCDKHGYIPESANELLKYVSSIMMREK